MKKLYVLFFIIIIATVGYGQFIEINAGLTGVRCGSTSWGDYDNDGDLDILLTGETTENSINYITKIYRNDGEGIYTDTLVGLVAVFCSSAAWGDYDNDNYLDILLTGMSVDGYVSRVYHNNGNGSFTDINAGLTGVGNSSVAWGDYDNDGDLDILLSGADSDVGNYHLITKIYRNNGNGTFTDTAVGLPGVMWSSVSWGDYDSDGDLDILLSGSFDDASRQYITRIYRNDGNDIFTDINAELIGVFFSSSAWGDYDNDGDLDVLISGLNYVGSNNYVTASKIYRNDGNGVFTDINAGLTSLYTGTASWGDYDNDGDLDILLTGAEQDNTTYFSKVYRNDGNDTFVDSFAGLLGMMYSSAAWGDYDNDGDLDILLSGWSRVDAYTYYFNTKIYHNATINHNTVPSVPSNLRASIAGNYVNFQWNSSLDTQTPSLGLSYAIRIGTTPGGNQISSTMSDAFGYRLISAQGLITSVCSWSILSSSLPEYFYWSVQAIDGAFAGSAFAIEQAYNTHPEITINTPQNINFGDTPINGTYEWYNVIVQNTGHAELSINSMYLFNIPSPFQYSYANLGLAIPPGEIDTILVRFAPTTVGVVNDTLYIESNVVNAPVLKIRLSGTGISVPPSPPQNVNVVMQGYNAFVSWDEVTTDIHGNTITPDCYIVLCNENPYADVRDYTYMGYTSQLSFVHLGVGRFRPQMYYRLVAYKEYDRSNSIRYRELIALKSKVTWAEIKAALTQ